MQKCLLNDSIQNIHRKYLAEHDSRKFFYSLFCMRLFWVVHPTTQDRETCQCKTHKNLTIMANKLKQYNILHTSNVEVLTDDIVCEPSNKAFMYDEYAVCKHNVPEVNGFLEDEMLSPYRMIKTDPRTLPKK